MEKIKQLLEFFATNLNEFDFVKFLNKIIEFFKILVPGKDDETTANA